jgi:hypothetical protein
MPRKLAAITPGEILREEFLIPMEISQNGHHPRLVAQSPGPLRRQDRRANDRPHIGQTNPPTE